jgi:purine-binding chemotaxis protein CheW
MRPLFNEIDRQGGAPGDVRQYLTFTLGQEVYGIDILKVQEIRGYAAVTPVPNTPAHVRGVMNLRGAIIPVVDLRRQFGRPEAEYDRFNVIVVINVGTKVVGLVVDAVSDVLDLPVDDIQQPPDFGESYNSRVISGLAKSGDKVVLLLDIDRVLGGEAEPAPAPALEVVGA